MKSREGLPLKENDRMTKLPQGDGRRGTGWTASGDGEVEVI